MVISPQQVEELEKKYFREISEVLKKNVNELVELFNSRLAILRDTQRITYKENEVDAGAERVLMSVICRNKDWKINSSPISSDLLFELPDALINIDAKTYKNKGKEENKVNVRRNQTSYGDKEYLTFKTGTKITWMAALREAYHHEEYGDLPCLTYIVKFIYDDNNQSLLEVQLISLPNGILKSIYGKNIFNRGKGSLTLGKPVPDIRFKISSIENPKLTGGWKRKEIIFKK